MPVSKLAEIAEFEGGAWDSPIDVDHFTWSFRWLPTSVLLQVLSKPRWKAWLDEERKGSAEERGGDYLLAMEHAWLHEPSKLGAIIMAQFPDGHIEIGDGWHRAAISVMNDVAEVPVIWGQPRRSQSPQPSRRALGRPGALG